MFDERVMEKLIRNMNEHIPSTRKSLAAMLDEGEPFYEGKDGRHYIVSKDELKKIAAVADPWDLNRIKIPILLMTDTSYGTGYWKVSPRESIRAMSWISASGRRATPPLSAPGWPPASGRWRVPSAARWRLRAP